MFSIIFGAAADARGESESDEKTDNGDDENEGKSGEVGGPLLSENRNASITRGTVLSVVKKDVEVRGVAETRAAKVGLQELDGLESVFCGGASVSELSVVNKAFVVLGESDSLGGGGVVVGISGDVNINSIPFCSIVSESFAARA